jgi:hypothetical protein
MTLPPKAQPSPRTDWWDGFMLGIVASSLVALFVLLIVQHLPGMR